MMGRYAIRGGKADKPRLDVLAEVARSSTLALLERIGIGPGDRCLDVGCGGGHVAAELARIVGPAGTVVGVDLDADMLQLARRDAEAAGLEHIDFAVGDARHLQGGDYDVVYSRCLLAHLENPEKVVERLVGLARVDGVVAIEDVDFG